MSSFLNISFYQDSVTDSIEDFQAGISTQVAHQHAIAARRDNSHHRQMQHYVPCVLAVATNPLLDNRRVLGVTVVSCECSEIDHIEGELIPCIRQVHQLNCLAIMRQLRGGSIFRCE